MTTKRARDSSTTIAPENSIHIKEDENREILLIAGNHGKDLVHILNNRLNMWSMSSILKSNTNITPFLKHSLTCLRHTNFFIFSSPLHPTNKYFNDRIYYDNLSLYKEAHSITGGLKISLTLI